MPRVIAQIPDDIYKNIEEEVKLGIFSSPSEPIEGVSEAEMLKEIETLRK